MEIRPRLSVVLEKSGTGAVRRKGLAHPLAGGSGFRPRGNAGQGAVPQNNRNMWSAGRRGVAQAASCVDDVRVHRAGVGGADDTVRRPALHTLGLAPGVRKRVRKRTLLAAPGRLTKARARRSCV